MTRIQIDAFDDLFKARLDGSGDKIPRAMEANFLINPKSASEIRIEKSIRDFRKITLNNLKQDITKQEKRLAEAERTLLNV